MDLYRWTLSEANGFLLQLRDAAGVPFWWCRINSRGRSHFLECTLKGIDQPTACDVEMVHLIAGKRMRKYKCVT